MHRTPERRNSINPNAFVYKDYEPNPVSRNSPVKHRSKSMLEQKPIEYAKYCRTPKLSDEDMLARFE